MIKGEKSQNDKVENIEQMMKITAEAAVEGSKLVAGLSSDETVINKWISELES